MLADIDEAFFIIPVNSYFTFFQICPSIYTADIFFKMQSFLEKNNICIHQHKSLYIS